MNTERYKVEYVEQVIELLKSTPNPVHLPSDVFFKIGKLFEGEPDREKLSALLRKTYTVMAIEDEKLVGLAGMDKEGNIGIFAASENPKAQKLLLNALDRRAEKAEVPQLFVQPFDDARDLFIRQGYEPQGEGNDCNLVRKITSKDELDFKPESAKSFTLD
ncbi:MAG: hypothetical protein K2M95_02275, partial [Clostridiales bacterium]|nr:hypothetical protein [Clostridiales bacterium]